MEFSAENSLILVGLLAAAAALLAIAQLVRVPYPILLVLGGLGLGFVPGMPRIELAPDLVLVAVLPPLLYGTAFFTSLRELRANVRQITLLAVGLVLTTMLTVAVVAHATIPGLTWPTAFVLGAIVSPTDPTAASAIAQRLGLPSRLIALVEGESLVNDGTALVAYRVAVAAVVTGSFSLAGASGRFLLNVAGGIAVGLAVGFVLRQVRRRIDNPPVEITISILSGYFAYLPAQAAGVSGILAAVTVGRFLWIFAATYLPRLLQRHAREGALFPPWREATVLTWSGMRGAVSLAAALALPLATDAGTPFPDRDLIVFLTFAVILGTLVLQGLTLPSLIDALGLEDDRLADKEEAKARIHAAEAALARLEELLEEEWVLEDTADRLRGLYNFRRERFRSRFGAESDRTIEDRSSNYQRLRHELLAAERRAILELRRSGRIDDAVMRRVERDLDLEDARLDL